MIKEKQVQQVLSQISNPNIFTCIISGTSYIRTTTTEQKWLHYISEEITTLARVSTTCNDYLASKYNM